MRLDKQYKTFVSMSTLLQHLDLHIISSDTKAESLSIDSSLLSNDSLLGQISLDWCLSSETERTSECSASSTDGDRSDRPVRLHGICSLQVSLGLLQIIGDCDVGTRDADLESVELLVQLDTGEC